jgi:hypothetical protein
MELLPRTISLGGLEGGGAHESLPDELYLLSSISAASLHDTIPAGEGDHLYLFVLQKFIFMSLDLQN